jgi:hypothetical protein
VITDSEIAAAEAAVAEARDRTADVADDDYARAAEVRRLALVADRTQRVQRAEQRVQALVARRDAQQRAVADHDNAVKDSGKLLGQLRKRLEAAEGAHAEAAKAVEDAVMALHAAAGRYNDTVAEASRDLLAAGIAAELPIGLTFETGGLRGGRQGVMLEGRAFAPIPPMESIIRSLYSAARSLVGENNGFAALFKGVALQVEKRVGGLFPALRPPAGPQPSGWPVLAPVEGARNDITEERIREIEQQREHERRQDAARAQRPLHRKWAQ